MGKGDRGGGGGGGGGGADGDVMEAGLQAILLADSFTETFRPITHEVPKVLLPLLGKPLMEYTLDFLVRGGVKEIIVFCCSHADKVRAFVEKYISSLGAGLAPRFRFVTSTAVRNQGDALREIDMAGIIASEPFVIVPGDVVTNVKLQDVIAFHKKQRTIDSETVMTSVLMKASRAQAARALTEDLVVALDATTQQILRFENSVSSDQIAVPVRQLIDHPRARIRYDLLDCQIDVCSADVLLHFSDNYDYEDIHAHYLHNEVQNVDLGGKFFAYLVSDEYGARVQDPRTYAAITKDVLAGWAYPMGPTTGYEAREGVLKAPKVSIAQSANLKPGCLEVHVVIGSNTRIEARARVAHSVIGTNCVVGARARVEGAFLWNNVTIGEGAIVESAILCDGVVIGPGAHVHRGCVLSYGVRIAANHVVQPFTKVTTLSRITARSSSFDVEEDSDTDAVFQAIGDAAAHACQASTVGVGGLGRLYPSEDDQISSLARDASLGVAKAMAEVSEALAQSASAADESFRRNLPHIATHIGAPELARARAWMWNSFTDRGASGKDADVKEDPFVRGLHDIIHSSLRDKVEMDTIALEVRSFKFAQHKSWADVIRIVLPTLFRLIPSDKTTTKAQMAQSVQRLVETWRVLLSKIIVGAKEQLATVYTVHMHCVEPKTPAVFRDIFGVVLEAFRHLKLIDAAVIKQWAEAAELADDAQVKALRFGPTMIMLLNKLDAPPSDSEDEEDSETDEGSSSESESGSGSGSGSESD